jgi:hypothetical protein
MHTPSPQPLYSTGTVTVTHDGVIAPSITVPIESISHAAVKRGMSAPQAIVGVLGGLLLLGSCVAPNMGVPSDLGTVIRIGCWMGVIIIIALGQTVLPSPYTVTLTTPHGRVALPPLTSKGAAAVMQALRTAQGHAPSGGPARNVVVRGPDGNEYPGVVVAQAPGQVQVAFPNGTTSWVPETHVRFVR